MCVYVWRYVFTKMRSTRIGCLEAVYLYKSLNILHVTFHTLCYDIAWTDHNVFNDGFGVILHFSLV